MIQTALWGVSRQIATLATMIKWEMMSHNNRRPAGFIEEVLDIFGMVAILVFMRVVLRGRGDSYGMPIVPFLFTGLVTIWMLKRTCNIVSAIPNSFGRFRVYQGVTMLDVAIARGLVTMVIFMGVGVVLYLGAVLFGFSPPIRNLPAVVGLQMTAGLIGLGLGLIFMAPFYYVKLLRMLIITFGGRIMIFMSGCFYVYPELSYSLRPYAVWNPLLHLNDMVREAYFTSYTASWVSPSYVAGWTVAILGAGLICERAFRNHLGWGRW
ncbi:ABC transporter permease [Methylobrevis albus]|uniref:Capsular polysaccharide transport system permease protein n=1 Tax=Methylobrevis albus TaxID=2793297 RepID=A0A931I1F9_9HYPH|nr:hypothetical protein [Methylobrevis albus]MBH0237649.1 hypothetical protein [Methylobrevis albus]